MFILGNFFIALAQIFNFILTAFYWLIIIRALISWVNPDPYNQIVQLLYRTTEPILQPIRKLLPVTMAIDISPIIAFLVIYFLKYFLVTSLFDIGFRLKS